MECHEITATPPGSTRDELESRLAEAEEAIRAIRAGEVDALVVSAPEGERIYTVAAADLAYRHFFEQMSEGAVVLDSEGVVLYCNGRLGGMLARPLCQVIGTELSRCLAVRHRHILEGLSEGRWRESHQEEIELVRSDGSTLPVHASMAPFMSEGLEAYCLILTDLSARFRIETEVRQARESAESANRAKGRFLAHMSHEIRTPMNAILGMTELTLSSSLTPEQRDNLGLVRSATLSLLSLVNDILDFSKIEAGKLVLELTEFDLSEQVHAVLDLFKQRASAKGIDLACKVRGDVPTRLVGDPSRLRQILINLVGNAIKFTEAGYVFVEAVPEPADASDEEAVCRLRFGVTDTGVGVTPGKEQAIFSPFVQADDSTTRTHGGTGLGLSISARLVELQGGRVWVESTPGMGSTFRFTSRFTRPGGAGAGPGPSSEGLRGLRAVVAVAGPLHRRVIAEVLSEWGLDVISEGDGDKAAEALERSRAEGRPFALALLELDLAGADGVAVSERLRLDPGLAGAVILIGHDSGLLGQPARPSRPGAARVLARPVRQTELFEVLLTAVGLAPPPSSRPKVPVNRRKTGGRGRPLRILVVEDHPMNRRVALLMLQERGHQVVLAADGREGVEAVRQGRFDVVLMDVQMPVMDGLQATAAIRAAEAKAEGGGRLPIIAMTAHALKEDLDRCLESGMDAYMTKPIDQGLLWETIAMWTEPAETAEPSKPAMDAAAAFERVGGDRAFLSEMILLFQEESPRLLENVQEAISRGDPHAVCADAHTLKNWVGNFVAPEAFAATQALEVAGHCGDLGQAQKAFALIVSELGRLGPELDRCVLR